MAYRYRQQQPSHCTHTCVCTTSVKHTHSYVFSRGRKLMYFKGKKEKNLLIPTEYEAQVRET